ncbi:MAG: class I SAM-dependent methyltransferase [Burkholderiales bacterium]|nr:class I SAM-dependent methyltransferase [Burkholderiales bacterium]MBW8892255.1 class I SAM-dependent methyltransferase [Burkholderiales bacterium]
MCGARAAKTDSIPGPQILQQVRASLPDLPAPGFAVDDYSLMACEACSLVFADPMKPGDNHFYGWICSSRIYYPSSRWEWGPLVERILAMDRPKVLDVGCGSGLFLETIRRRGIEGLGVDPTEESVAACRARGFEARRLSIQEMADSPLGQFGVVTLFHVLEHVADPLGAIQVLKRSLGPTGLFAVSVPYSPMSFETDWRDPLNRPPHHLSRWNERSLRALAAAAGMSAEVLVQPARSMAARVLSTMQLKLSLPPVEGGSALQRKARLAWRLLSHPIEAATIAYHQTKRDRETGGAKGDAVMMIMRHGSAQ